MRQSGGLSLADGLTAATLSFGFPPGIQMHTSPFGVAIIKHHLWVVFFHMIRPENRISLLKLKTIRKQIVSVVENPEKSNIMFYISIM
jgi:hypothetical protein